MVARTYEEEEMSEYNGINRIEYHIADIYDIFCSVICDNYDNMIRPAQLDKS